MSTNSEALQAYIEGFTPHIGDSGMLGLGEGLSLLATFLLFVVVLYIIGGFRHKKRFGKWLKPDGYYFKGIGDGFTAFFATFMGVGVPKAFVDSSDGRYAALTEEQVRECVASAYDSMHEAGITYKDLYRWRSFDCEDFATAMKFYATLNYTQSMPQPNKGAPFALFGYTRGNGQKHVCLKAIAGGESVFFEVYPDYRGELKLTPKEIKSRDLELF